VTLKLAEIILRALTNLITSNTGQGKKAGKTSMRGMHDAHEN
jgi:hypothetical protein